jgi:enamine deaminase RidA (YjgF/YER057c/UK114 family)
MEYKGTLGAFGIKNINAPGLGERLSDLLHISSAVVVPAHTATVVTSGQTGYTQDMVYPSDTKEQILLAFHNVEEALRAAGVQEGWKAVYQMTTYHANGLTDEVSEALDAAVAKYFGGNRPAWTGIEVKSLYGGAIIEIAVSAALKA